MPCDYCNHSEDKNQHIIRYYCERIVKIIIDQEENSCDKGMGIVLARELLAHLYTQKLKEQDVYTSSE
jgi:hypothetical protein